MGILALSFIAGLLTCLSPCVFPVVPLIVGSSLQRSPYGPIVLAFGLVVSFTFVGALLFTTGAAAGVSEDFLRPAASVLLIIAGIFLLSKTLQDKLSTMLSPLAAKADRSLQSSHNNGLLGQFLTGCMLGVLWSPCTGPTMGATLALGAQSGVSFKVISSMLVFGIGAATPILGIAYGARSFLISRRGSILTTASRGKTIFGWCIIAVGVFTLLGFDKALESAALDILPDWLTEFSVKY
jgi:cytochrome c biogenesis protein CcdA